METKLTLRMDEELIRQAKKTAQERGKSLSRLVADYFELLGRKPPTLEKQALPPITRSLFGIAAGAVVTEEDYRRHLEEKHR